MQHRGIGAADIVDDRRREGLAAPRYEARKRLPRATRRPPIAEVSNRRLLAVGGKGGLLLSASTGPAAGRRPGRPPYNSLEKANDDTGHWDDKILPGA